MNNWRHLCFIGLLCAGLLVAGAADFTPQWRISKSNAKYVKIEGDRLMVDVPPGVSNVCAYATADIDLSNWAQRCLEAEVRCRGTRLVRDARPARGVKLSLHYTDPVEGNRRYPAAPAPEEGDFGWTNLQLSVTFGEVPPPATPTAQVVLGLQQTSGRLEFDLSSFKLRNAPPIFPGADNDYKVQYPAAVVARGRMRGVMGRGCCRNTEHDIQDLYDYGANLIRLQMNGFADALLALRSPVLEIDWPDIRALQETCLRSGINKVGLPDLIIAQQAIRLGIPLFSLDRHFVLMSKHVPLALWPK